MRAVVLKEPRRLVVEEIPLFPMAADEVMVQVEACGICGSDLRYYLGENPWALHTKGAADPNPPNMVLGHEFVGRVVEAGGPAGADLVGKRVAVLPYHTCGRCDNCRRGLYHLCAHTIHTGHGAGWGEQAYFPGAYAEFCPIWADRCAVLPEWVPPHEAALIDGLGVAVHAVRQAGFTPGANNVAVLGCGPVGVAVAAVARACGARQIFGTDVYDVALRIAGEVAAVQPIDVRAADPVAAVRAGTDGLGVRYAFDTVCTAETQQQALAMLGSRGVLVNLAPHNLEVPLNLLQLGAERSIRGSSNSTLEDFQTAVEMLVAGQFKAAPQITHRVPLEAVPETIEMLLQKETVGAFKAVVEPGRSA